MIPSAAALASAEKTSNVMTSTVKARNPAIIVPFVDPKEANVYSNSVRTVAVLKPATSSHAVAVPTLLSNLRRGGKTTGNMNADPPSSITISRN
ncbi:MAG: hypothetical protein NVSMB66_0390 [Candidatus Doudnabacteria bacterium]